MAFMDDINKKLTRFGASALERTKEASDSIKINSAIREEEDRQKELFRQIGEKFFNAYGASGAGEFTQLCRQIQESMEKAEEYRRQLMRLKGVRTCGVCGQEVAVNAAFCSHCGAPMRAKESVNSAPNICKCGHPLESGAKFCTWCGTPVQQAGNYGTEEIYSPEREERICPKCGSIIEKDQKFCAQCGAGPIPLDGESGEQTSGNPAGGDRFGAEWHVEYSPDYYRRAYEEFEEKEQMDTADFPEEQLDADSSARTKEPYDGIQVQIEKQAEEFAADSETGDADAGGSPEAGMKKCPGCGAELREEQRFCINCGRKCDDTAGDEAEQFWK